MALSPHRLRTFFKPILLLILVGALVVSRFIPTFAAYEEALLHRIITPVFSVFSQGVGSISRLLKNYVLIAGAARENEGFKSEIAELKGRVRELEEEKTSLERQWALLQSFDSLSEKKEIARVVAYDPLPSSKTIWIDRGSQNGIQNGQAVLGPKGVVGVVVKTSGRDAQVMLLTDPRSAVDGEVRPSGARGVLRGARKNLDLGRDFWLTRMEYLGVHQEVHEKDSVVTSGLDQIFPPGLPLGKVQKILRDEKGLFLSAEVIPEVDFTKLKDVVIMIR